MGAVVTPTTAANRIYSKSSSHAGDALISGFKTVQSFKTVQISNFEQKERDLFASFFYHSWREFASSQEDVLFRPDYTRNLGAIPFGGSPRIAFLCAASSYRHSLRWHVAGIEDDEPIPKHCWVFFSWIWPGNNLVEINMSPVSELGDFVLLVEGLVGFFERDPLQNSNASSSKKARNCQRFSNFATAFLVFLCISIGAYLIYKGTIIRSHAAGSILVGGVIFLLVAFFFLVKPPENELSKCDNNANEQHKEHKIMVRNQVDI